ncbi:M48 family metalloprotease [Magnetospirillum sp. 15-1]|uniref:M48 family metalloprotease n=1 Tax=Magnetospirillum sp. 15-1 TaxID=1979370 RepID=UPI001141E18D|nr:M48 family metalloprotease [Magnetospirillum sp. 15-1]
MLDRRSLQDQLRRNRRDTGLILMAMALLMSLAGWLLAGGSGVVAALAAAGLALAVNPHNSVAMLRALYRAVPLPVAAAPGLWRGHAELCRRAGLAAVPPLLIIPSRAILALSTGWGRHCAVALSEGALALLPPDEVVAILAHEIAHIRAGDLKLLRLADAAGHLTHTLVAATLILLVFFWPDMMAANALPDLWVVGALVLAPVGCDLLRLSLSRTREFAADAGAAELCGSPEALISALTRLSRDHGTLSPLGWLRLVRTHPTTEERIVRLRNLAPPSFRLPEIVVLGGLPWLHR